LNIRIKIEKVVLHTGEICRELRKIYVILKRRKEE